jgi:hypothetical protein
MSEPIEPTAEQLLRAARASRRRRDWNARYRIARTRAEALTACEEVRLWLEELACNPVLDYAAEHCVAEALRDLRVVRGFVGGLAHDA